MSLKQRADGVSMAEIFGNAGNSQAIYFKKRYERSPIKTRPFNQLEKENATLRKLVADLRLHRELLQDAIRRRL
jgi:putative transposase